MNLEQGQELHGFTVLTAEPLPEIDGDAYTLSHPVSGAKLLYLRNDDRNKAFSIAFRTPPADDTGVFHILEHSVLCGSEKFPVKEPFVNLLKTSMQTFLNAMTFGDKTLYPVASTNDQDLMNLADVYMDAVLHPDIYRKRQVFEQEGWHLEVADADEAQADDGNIHVLLLHRLHKVMELQQLLRQAVEHLRLQGLGAIAQGMGRVVVDLDQQSVGTGGHGAHGQGIYQPALAGGMAGIDDDGQVGQLPQHGDAGQIQGVAGDRFKGADAPFA